MPQVPVGASTYVELCCGDGDRTLSLADQMRSSSDQARADRDQEASDRDQEASDRDQAASDRDLERGVVSTREHGCSHELRLRGTRQRRQTAQARLDAADKRHEISDVRGGLAARARDARARLS